MPPPITGVCAPSIAPHPALSHYFQGLFGGSFRLTRSLAPSSAARLVLQPGGRNEPGPKEPKLDTEQSETRTSSQTSERAPVQPQQQHSSILLASSQPVRHQHLTGEEQQLIKQPIHQSIGVLVHGDPQTSGCTSFSLGMQQGGKLSPTNPAPSKPFSLTFSQYGDSGTTVSMIFHVLC